MLLATPLSHMTLSSVDMADFVKKKIIEKLAKFTRDIKPSDISLSFLRGKGELRNLDLNTEVIASALQLPPWINIDHVFCDTIKLDVPFTEINKSPIKCMLGLVTIHVSTSRDVMKREKADLLGNTGSSTSSYGLTEKIIDGMRIEIRAINVFFENPVFKATLEISDVVIESTTPQWKPDILSNCRFKNEAEGTVVIYKKATWSSIKVEGSGVEDDTKEHHLSQLRLITSVTEIRVSLKRQLSNCKVVSTRVSMILGDLVWVVTQSQLKALSRLAQSLTESAVNFAQFERVRLRSSCESLDSIESSSSVYEERKPDKPMKRSQSPRKDDKDIHKANRLLEYQMGVKNLPSYEVIQDSFHLKTGNVDIQLCDENASLLLQVRELLVDVYLDQLAGSGRCHWNKSNIRLQENVVWSNNLIRQADKKQDVSLASVNIYRLRERGILIRCSDFCIKSVTDDCNDSLLPIMSCDKETFNLPNDVDNPAFQCGITLYYYPVEAGNKFLVPRPNISVYLSPIHVNVHQEQCLWLAEFIHGVALTVNLNLLLSAHTEGQHFIQELKAKQDLVNKLNGIDFKFYLPYSKITLPVAEKYEDGRPRALQIETGGVNVENYTLLSLLGDEDFMKAWNRVKSGWFLANEEQFPHKQDDPSVLPINLVELIESEIKAMKAQPPQRAASSANLLKAQEKSTRASAPDIVTVSSSHKRITTDQLKLLTLESWCAHTRCVTVSFVADLSHKATMYSQYFVNDFPLHVWIFQPKEYAKILELAAPTGNTSYSLSPLPSLYALVDIADPISLELQHLQFLFLMRLKDSFQGFKNRIMKYFSIDTFLETQHNEAFHLHEDINDTNEVDNVEDMKGKLKAAFTQENRSRSNSKSNGDFVTTGFTLSGIEASVMLPTLTKVSKRKKGSSTNSSYGAQEVSEAILPEVTVSLANLSDTTESSNIPSLPVLSADSPSPSLPVADHPTSLTNSTSSLSVSLAGSKSPLPVTLTDGNCLPVSFSDSPSQQSLADNHSDEFLVICHPSEISEAMETNYDVVANRVETPVSSGILSTERITPKSVMGSTETPSTLLTPPENASLFSESLGTSPPKTADLNVHVPLISQMASTSELQNNGLKSASFISTTTSVVAPEYLLYVETGIVRGVATVSSDGIGIKAAVDSVDINELKEHEYKEQKDKKERRKRKSPTKSEEHCLPVIKARVELGKSVKSYFKEQSNDSSDIPVNEDGVVFLKVSGLKPNLALKNTMAMKDFFDDEVESDTPIPMQIRIMETQITLTDYVSAPLNHPRNLTVNIPDLFVNRGPRALNTNLLLAEGGSTTSCTFDTENKKLLNPENDQELSAFFQKFLEAIKNHTVDNENRTSSPDPQRLKELLKELQILLTAPPTYLDVMSCDFYTNMTADNPHPTVDSLQTDLERLKKENLQLQKELELSRQEAILATEERGEIVSELVQIKMKYATLHLTHEKQLMQIDRLLTEKTDLQEQVKGTSNN